MGRAHLFSVAGKVLLVASLALMHPPSALAGAIEGKVRAPGNRGAADFVVYVKDEKGPSPSLPPRAVVNQKGLRFVPHVLAIQAGTTVEFPNSDPLLHNVFSISGSKRFNLGLYGRGAVRSLNFDKPGVVQLLCNVHLEMSGFIVIVDNPYFAKTGTDGSFYIDGVPEGEHRLALWHERFAAQERVVRVPASGTVKVDWMVQ